jgi:hypothetical protein
MKIITYIITICLCIILTLIIVIYSQHIDNSNQKNNIIQLSNTVDSLKNIENKQNINYKKFKKYNDSILKINFLLSKYRGLTDAMNDGDSIRKALKYQIGDIVYLKLDSTKCLIQDILIGGTKFNYYIKYQILKKNNDSFLIEEEFIQP